MNRGYMNKDRYYYYREKRDCCLALVGSNLLRTSNYRLDRYQEIG